jgi:hypothetical protein
VSGRYDAELRLIFDRDGVAYRVCTIKRHPDGTIYFLNHHPYIGGKTSQHPNGTATHELKLIGLRRSSPGLDNSVDSDHVAMVGGFGGGGTAGDEPGIRVGVAKRDTRTRKSLRLDWPTQPERVWGVEVWVCSSGADEAVVEAARSTPPYVTCRVVGSLLADWVEPRMLLKVWKSETERPFVPIKAVNRFTGESFIRIPPQYVGTRFARSQSEEDLWFPRPHPREHYGPEPWRLHPAYFPEAFEELVVAG